ncbi:MAG: methyl-accepting chemotaxis protein [Thermoanaerobacterales bacterium]|nr:methyl-accepting chemotaxis protein [Thermoanaerobacterales bacterium]
MHIRYKILAGYLGVFLVFSVLGVFTLTNMYRMQNSYRELIDHRARMVSETKDLLLAVEYEALMLRTYLLTGGEEWNAEYRRQAQLVDQRLAQLEAGLTTEEEKVLFASLKRSVTGLSESYAETLLAVRQRSDLTDQQKLAEVIRITVAKRGTVRGIIAQGEDFIAYQQRLMDQAVAANEAWVKRISGISTTLGLLSLVLGVIAALYISRTIADPVRQIEEQVNRIARGDLTSHELEIASRDEVGRLARSFGVMLANLRGVTGRLQTTAEEMGRFATDLRANARDAVAAAGTTTEVLARATDTVGDLTERAQALAGVSDRASEQAAQVQEATARVLHQMESTNRVAARASKAVRDLGASLADVRQIVEFISQFAEQANLLARKAADELMDEGMSREEKGVFLNLVQEIRTRAQEAARATDEVTKLITTVQRHAREAVSSVDEDCRLVAEGRISARQAVEAFSGLVKEVHVITGRIDETAAAIRDFSAALAGVTRASQAQTILVENVAQVSATLDGLALELREALATLKL